MLVGLRGRNPPHAEQNAFVVADDDIIAIEFESQTK